jgi:hypothetical protein
VCCRYGMGSRTCSRPVPVLYPKPIGRLHRSVRSSARNCAASEPYCRVRINRRCASVDIHAGVTRQGAAGLRRIPPAGVERRASPGSQRIHIRRQLGGADNLIGAVLTAGRVRGGRALLHHPDVRLFGAVEKQRLGQICAQPVKGLRGPLSWGGEAHAGARHTARRWWAAPGRRNSRCHPRFSPRQVPAALRRTGPAGSARVRNPSRPISRSSSASSRPSLRSFVAIDVA